MWFKAKWFCWNLNFNIPQRGLQKEQLCRKREYISIHQVETNYKIETVTMLEFKNLWEGSQHTFQGPLGM